MSHHPRCNVHCDGDNHYLEGRTMRRHQINVMSLLIIWALLMLGLNLFGWYMLMTGWRP